MTEEGFQKLFLEAVDGAFSSLGESARQAIYFHLETEFKMPRSEIPDRLEDFERGLEKIFGIGTRFLEILIMKKLYQTIQPKGKILRLGEGKEFRFVDYVKAAERTFSRKRKQSQRIRSN